MRESDTLITTIQQLQASVREIKNAQLLAGDGWIVYRNVTSNSLDIAASLGTGEVRRWLISFTPDVDRDTVASAQFIISSTGIFDRYIVQRHGVDTEWYFVARTDFGIASASTIDVKFVVYSTQSGTVVVTAI